VAPRRLAQDVAPDIGVGDDGGGRAFGDDGALGECQDARRVALDDVEVVLDEHHGAALALGCAHHHVHDGEFLLGADAAGRLVEQQEARRAHRRHGDVEELAHALRQEPRRLVAVLRDAETLEQRLHRRQPRRPAQRLPQREGAALGDAAGDEQIVGDAQAGEDLRHLERARDAGGDDGARRQRGDVAAEEGDAAGARLQIAGDEVDEGCLAGPVGADDADALALGDADIDVVGGDDRAETLVEADDVEQRAHGVAVRRARRRAGRWNSDHTPCGRKRIMSSRHTPRIICQL
jgi:hypothetical protein